jgi:glycine C-acetyltransferase
MLYDSRPLLRRLPRNYWRTGIYVIGFFFPVVAKGSSENSGAISAAHEQHHLDKGNQCVSGNWKRTWSS